MDAVKEYKKVGNTTSQKLRKPLVPGMSRKEIAEKLGVSWRTVENWEQGRCPVPKWIRLAIKNISQSG